MNAKLSPHFTADECKCPHCGALQIDMRLIKALEELRALASTKLKKDCPLKLTSVYRCAEHNAKVGGGQASEHTRGLAADVVVPKGLTLTEFYAMADEIAEFKNGGVGVYPEDGFLHVDIRGKRARWARVASKYVGIEVGLLAATKKGSA